MKDKASAASHSSFIIPHSSFAFMLPEISRRCMSCGAAVRAGARFCPQCGKVMAGAESRPSAATTESRAAQSSVEGPSDARGRAETAGGTGVQRRAGGANDDAAPVNDDAAPVTRDAEAPGEWAKPTREFSAFVESLDDEIGRAHV